MIVSSSSDIPQGWQKIRLKRIASLNPSKREIASLPDDTEVTFLPMEVVSESWEVDYSRIRPLEEIRNGYTYFRNGDILLAKITPCFENGKGALVNDCVNGFGFGTTEFHVIRATNLNTTRFLSYVVCSHRFKVEGAGMMSGTAGQKRLSDDYVKDFEVFLPSQKIQGVIASFLDRKTAAIATLIAKKQRLIQLLEEKRIAVINQAVTKGLNSNVQMKDSGIPWLGEIPEHWKVLHLKRVIALSNYGISDQLEPIGTYPVLRMGNLQNEQVIMDDIKYVDEVDPQLILEPNDILFNRTNSRDLVGKVALFRGNSDAKVTYASYLVRFRVNELVEPEYLVLFLGRKDVQQIARAMALPAIGQVNLRACF